MSDSTSYAMDSLREWLSSKRVGEFVTHTGPKGDAVVLIKESIKYKDLDADAQVALKWIFNRFDAINLEIATGKDGIDRVKVTRSL